MSAMTNQAKRLAAKADAVVGYENWTTVENAHENRHDHDHWQEQNQHDRSHTDVE